MNAIVIGAGACGLPTASELVRRNHDATLIDRHGVANSLSSSLGPTRMWRVADPEPLRVRLGYARSTLQPHLEQSCTSAMAVGQMSPMIFRVCSTVHAGRRPASMRCPHPASDTRSAWTPRCARSTKPTRTAPRTRIVPSCFASACTAIRPPSHLP